MATGAEKEEDLPLYLGLDLSTQQLKAVCVDEQLRVTHPYHVDFVEELPEFGTVGGVVEGKDGLTVTTPTLLWVKALDLLLEKMQGAGFPFSRVVGVSGSGQQHGSVYWREGAGRTLSQLEPHLTLHDQLQSSFSVAESPVWKDSSTGQQCLQLEEAFGGPLPLAQVTGSRAYERFTGNQIAKIFQQKSTVEAYREFDKTERISLVSSFLASIFLGQYASIDYSDGSGMNLLDISQKQWSAKALEVCAAGFNLVAKLGDPVPSNSLLGPIAPHFVKRFGFSPSCQLVAFTGDNPSSLAGMRLTKGDVVMSLGTSDTLIFWIDSSQPQLMGHVFVNPVDHSAFMAMLCYKNGSKTTREMIRDRHTSSKSWEEFNELLRETDAGNGGNIGIYFPQPEITPSGPQGEFRWNSSGTPVPSFPPEVEVRAVVEGQFMAKWIHTRRLGYTISPSSRILATGGASENTAILQIVADIFNAGVYVLTETANSAGLGAAYRAKQSLMPSGTDFMEAVKHAADYTQAVSPNEHNHYQVYQPLCERYAVLESSIS